MRDCFVRNVIPVLTLFEGLPRVGVRTGLWDFVGIIWGGAGKLGTSTELFVNSSDLRFLDRVGAIVLMCVSGRWQTFWLQELVLGYFLNIQLFRMFKLQIECRM
jgi:hypothetical protein